MQKNVWCAYFFITLSTHLCCYALKRLQMLSAFIHVYNLTNVHILTDNEV